MCRPMSATVSSRAGSMPRTMRAAIGVARGQHRLPEHVRRGGLDVRLAHRERGDPLPVGELRHAADLDVRRDRQDAVAQLLLEPVHHRQHDDQRRDAEHDARHRDQRDERDEGVAARALAGARVAQADGQFVGRQADLRLPSRPRCDLDERPDHVLEDEMQRMLLVDVERGGVGELRVQHDVARIAVVAKSAPNSMAARPGMLPRISASAARMTATCSALRERSLRSRRRRASAWRRCVKRAWRARTDDYRMLDCAALPRFPGALPTSCASPSPFRTLLADGARRARRPRPRSRRLARVRADAGAPRRRDRRRVARRRRPAARYADARRSRRAARGSIPATPMCCAPIR